MLQIPLAMHTALWILHVVCLTLKKLDYNSKSQKKGGQEITVVVARMQDKQQLALDGSNFPQWSCDLEQLNKVHPNDKEFSKR